jgi:xanthine/uracil permease
MSTKLFNKFWVAVTAVITIGLLAYLFPLLLDKYGILKAILLACLIPVAMGLAYFRGYWVSTLFEKKDKQENR